MKSLRLSLLIGLSLICSLRAADDHGLNDALSAEANALAPAFIVPTGPAPTPVQRIQVGQWGPVINWTPHIPVTAATLPDGRLLTFSSNQRTTFPVGAEFTYAAVWNPATGVFTEINNTRHDMFCGGTAMLPDGRVMINGGRNTTRLSSIFDWRTNQWVAIPNMNDGRWYNTSVALTDGSVFTVTGDGGTNTAERWTAANGWRRYSGINWATVVSQPGYVTRWHPLMLLAPDGRVFHGGPTRQMNWVTTDGNGSLTYSGVNVPGVQYPKEGCFAMYAEGRILVAGGSSNTNQNPSDASTGTSTNLAFTIDIRSGTPVVTPTASMKFVRQFANSVILPTGEVMVIGGNSSGLKFNDTGSILAPEIWNPTTGQWREVTDMSVPRNYHSLALLLPDGRVWSGGGGLSGNSADHRDGQLYTPPTLFAADGTAAVRPVLTQAPAYTSPGTVFSVQGTAGLTKFSFIKMSSQTHSMNTDLRFLNVPFIESQPGVYALTAHSNLNVLTPGYWMLFGLNAAGVYSEAKVIQVDPTTSVAVANPGSQISAQNAPVTLAIYGQSPGGSSLSYSATGLPTGLTISAVSGVISGTPSAAGNYTPRVTVTDNITTAFTEFTWSITPPNVSYTYANFTGSAADFQLAGNATVNAAVLQLTENVGNQVGAAFLKNPVPISANTSFTTRFVFRMAGTADGADGMTFVIQADRLASLGSAGGGLGYEGILKSLAIELDSYQGGSDPNGNHLGVLNGGVVATHQVTFSPSFDLENGASHTAWVEYDGPTNTLRVYLSQGVVTTRPTSPIITQTGVDLPSMTGASAWVGFTGATGGQSNTHEILAWQMTVNAFALPTAPVLTSPGALTSVVGAAVSQAIQASDINQETLTFSATGLPPGLVIQASTGLITGTPTTAGSFSSTVTVTDGNTSVVSVTFPWTISSTLTILPLQNSPASGAGPIAFTAQTTGGANPRYKWNFGDGTPETTFSTNATINHTYAAPGRYLVTVTVTDDTGLQATRSFYQAVHAALTARKPTQSSSLLFEDRPTGNDRLWIVNPDADTVTILDAVTRTKLAETSVGTAPRSLALAPDGRVWVTNVESATISILDASSFAVAQTLTLPRGSRPFGLAFDPIGSAAFVALEGSGQLLKLNPSTGAQLASVAVGLHARHVSVDANSARVYVSRFITPPLPGENTATVNLTGQGGEVIVVAAASMTVERTIRLGPSLENDSPTSARGIPNYLGATALSPDGLFAWVPSKQDNVQRGSLRDGVGLNHDQSLRAIASRIDLTTQAEVAVDRVDFDNAGMPSASVFDTWGTYVFTALEANRAVAVIDAWSRVELTRFQVGRAPQGLALSPDGRTLYVQNFMDRSVSVHDVSTILQGQTPAATTLATVSTVTTEKLSSTVLKGKQLFYDALDSRLALQEYISCATCHNDGGQDGRVWDLTGFGEGLRNTITLRGHGAQGALHWTGNFDEVHDFEGQIRNLAGGTGLLSDAQFNTGTRNQPLGDPKAGLSADLDALAAYVTSLTAESRSPHRNTDGSLTASAVSGERIFRQQNCASCHSGTGFTNSALNVFRDIGTIKPSTGKRLNGTLTGLDVPTLRGLWATAPYLHDGSAATLSAAVTAHASVALSTTEHTDLTAYLQQIDDAPAIAPLPVTVTLTTTAISPVNSAFIVTATFSHPVTGFALSDLSLTGANASALTGSGTSYSFTLTPTGNVSLSLAANVAQDSTGLGNLASNALTLSFTTPSVVLIGQDVGLGLPGSTSFDSSTGIYTLTGSGEDIFFNADGFHFSQVNLNGDGEIRARVRSFAAANPWAKAGVMIRENLTAGSRHATAFITPVGAGNGFGMVWRSTASAATTYSGGPALNAVPNNWVRLVRSGNVITGYASANGSTWTLMSSTTLSSLTAQVQIGLAVTASDSSAAATATFDNVMITGAQAAVPPAVTLSAASTQETGPFTVQAQFTQPVTGLTLTDFVITNATASNLIGSSSSYSLTLSPTATGEITIRLPAGAAQNAAAVVSTASNNLSVLYTPPTLVSLQGQDIGGLATAGSTTYDSATSTYTLRGAGADIFFNSDGFQYAMTQLTGDGEIRARVTSQTNLNPWAKAGVMFRESLTGGARHAMMFTTPTGAGNGFGMVWRSGTSGATTYTSGPALNTAPNNWVRLVRTGNVLTGFASANGTAWTQVSTTTLTGLPNTLYVGLALTSGSLLQLSTATFDNVQIVGAQTVVAPTVTLSSASAIESGAFTVQAQFSQNVSGLTLSDFQISNATPSNLSGTGSSYALTLTPTAEGPVTISLPANAAQNAGAAGSTASNVLSVTYTPAISIALQGQDIGAVGLTGSTAYDSATGTYTLLAAGADIFFTADGFQFASTQLTGDGEIRARVTRQTNTNPWAKAGVMIRESMTPGSRHALAFTTPTGAGNGYGMVWRLTNNAATNYAGGPGLSAAPNNWVRLVRVGDLLTSYTSSNGTAWTLMSSTTLSGLPSTLHVGLALTASTTGSLATATFDNVQVVSTQAPVGGSTPPNPGSSPNPPGGGGPGQITDSDVDGDGVNDLIEYALGNDESYDGGWWLTTTTDGRVDAHLIHPSAISDVSFQIETSADLQTWSPLAISPTAVDFGGGLELLTWSGLSSLSGQSPKQGLVRLRVNQTTGLAAVTSPQGWQRHSLIPGTQTVGLSLLNAPLYAGLISGVVGSDEIQLSTASALNPQANLRYYLEVRDGAHVGHRFEIAQLGTSSVVIDLTSPLNTQPTLPADLLGAQVTVRPHLMLGQVFEKNRLKGATAPASADQVLFHTGSTWQTHWLLKTATFHQWIASGDATAADSHTRLIPPGTGLMVKIANQSTTFTLTGHVRTHAFIRPLVVGQNLLAPPRPLAASPNQLGFRSNNAFTPGLNQTTADQILRWTGDTTPGTSTYTTYWLLKTPTGGRWTLPSDATLPDLSDTLLIPADRAFFYKAQASSPLWRSE